MLKIFKFAVFITIVFNLSVFVSAQNKTAQDFFDEGIRNLETGDSQKALPAFIESAKLDSKKPETFINLGKIYNELNRQTESVAAFRHAVKLAPKSAEFRAEFCKALSYDQKFTEAMSECNEALRLDANSLSANKYLILVYQMQNRPPAEILRLTESALQKFPDDPTLTGVAASLYAETGNYVQAAAMYEKVLASSPKNALFQIQLAGIYLQLERDSDAIATVQKAIEINPKYMLARFFLGKIYLELGLNEEAANAFQIAADLDPNYADTFYYLGLAKSRIGKTDEAIAALKKAVELFPDDFEYNKELGAKLSEASRYEEAIAPYRTAVKQDPKNFDAKIGLGLVLFESTKYEEALPILMEAERMKPGNEATAMFLNVTRARQQGLAQVEQMKDFAVKNPDDLNVRMNLIQILGFGRKMDEAETYIQEVLKMNSKDVRVYQSIAAVYSTAGKFDEAVKVYRKLISIDPTYPGPYLGLASIYEKKGLIAEASQNYEKMIELQPNAWQTMTLYANFLRDNGKKREALAMYKRSLEISPTNAVAVFNAGMLSLKLNDRDSAQIYLERLKSLDPQMAKTLSRILRLKNL